MRDKEKVKKELLNLADKSLENAALSLDALNALIPESSVKDLNTLYSNSLKAHKELITQIMAIEKEEREAKILEASNRDVDLSGIKLEL